MHGTGVLERAQLHQEGTLANRGALDPALHRLPAGVGFDDDIDPLDADELRRIPGFIPEAGSRNAQRRNVVEPERVAVGLALDEHHVLRRSEPPQAVESWLVALAPGEAPIAIAVLVQAEPDAHRNLVAFTAEVRNPQRRAPEIADLGHVEGAQERFRQLFARRVALHRCTVAVLIGGY